MHETNEGRKKKNEQRTIFKERSHEMKIKIQRNMKNKEK